MEYGFTQYHYIFESGEEQIAIFKNNTNLLNINIFYGAGGFSYQISSPKMQKNITSGTVSYANFQKNLKDLPSRIIKHTEKTDFSDLIRNQSHLSKFTKKHDQLFKDIHKLREIHKSNAISNYITSVQKEIKNDWRQAGKQIFQGFKTGIDDIIHNNKTYKKFNRLVKTNQLGYKIFSDILLSYAIPSNFVQEASGIASRFLTSHQHFNKDLVLILSHTKKSILLENKFYSLSKRLKVIQKFHQIGSINISKKKIDSIKLSW